LLCYLDVSSSLKSLLKGRVVSEPQSNFLANYLSGLLTELAAIDTSNYTDSNLPEILPRETEIGRVDDEVIRLALLQSGYEAKLDAVLNKLEPGSENTPGELRKSAKLLRRKIINFTALGNLKFCDLIPADKPRPGMVINFRRGGIIVESPYLMGWIPSAVETEALKTADEYLKTIKEGGEASPEAKEFSAKHCSDIPFLYALAFLSKLDGVTITDEGILEAMWVSGLEDAETEEGDDDIEFSEYPEEDEGDEDALDSEEDGPEDEEDNDAVDDDEDRDGSEDDEDIEDIDEPPPTSQSVPYDPENGC